MRFIAVAMSLASLLCVSGCWSSKTLVVGGARQMFFPAGSEVPSVGADENKEGWYSLSAHDLEAILNP